MTISELATALGVAFEGQGTVLLIGAATLEEAQPGHLSFLMNAKVSQAARISQASCLIVPDSYEPAAAQTVIRHGDPRLLFARALALLYPSRKNRAGVHPTAVVDATADIGADVEIGPFAVISGGARIGDRCRIGPHCTIGAGAEIGQDGVLQAGVRVYDSVRIGARAIVHAGAVLGADGFGFVPTREGWEKFPQVGSVEIGDDVEIGANSCIDRAALGVTRIGDGVKLDNQVHIGHNCAIGNHVVIAAQTGLSGGVVVGDRAIIGGQVGIGDKVRIEPGAVLGSGCGVLTGKIVHAGQPVWGTPARPLREYLKQLAAAGKFAEVREEIKLLQVRVAELEQLISHRDRP